VFRQCTAPPPAQRFGVNDSAFGLTHSPPAGVRGTPPKCKKRDFHLPDASRLFRAWTVRSTGEGAAAMYACALRPRATRESGNGRHSGELRGPAFHETPRAV